MPRGWSWRKSSDAKLDPSDDSGLGAEHPPGERNSAAATSFALPSLVFGASLAYICFVLFLQTPDVSRTRLVIAGALLLAASAASYLVLRRLFLRAGKCPPGWEATVLLSLALPALFLPSLYREPPFPSSPLLRPWTEISVVIQSSPLPAPPAPLSRDAVTLTFDGGQVLFRDRLNPNAKWQRSSDASADEPGTLARYLWRGDWAGTASEQATLSIAPAMVDGQLHVTWDRGTTTLALGNEDRSPIELRKIFPPPWGYSLLFFVSIYVVLAWLLAVVTTRFSRELAHLLRVPRIRWGLTLIVAMLMGLSILTVWLQVQHLPDGLRSLTDLQLQRHDAVISGQAPNPWQYRLLSEMVAELVILIFRLFSVQQPHVFGFLLLRVLQNVALFSLAFALYRKLSGSKLLGLVGTLVLASSMTHVFYDSDLSFNTYFDVIFYLAAALLLLSDNFTGAAMVAPFAALNRETSALIPVMMFATLAARGKWRRRELASAIAAAFAFLLVFAGLRLSIPPGPLFVPHGQPLGLRLLVYNLTRGITWSGLFATLGAVPVIGLLCVRSWPRLWRAFLVVVCPVWFLAHFLGGVAAETRLFLVPQAMVFVPGALFCAAAIARMAQSSSPARVSLG